MKSMPAALSDAHNFLILVISLILFGRCFINPYHMNLGVSLNRQDTAWELVDQQLNIKT